MLSRNRRIKSFVWLGGGGQEVSGLVMILNVFVYLNHCRLCDITDSLECTEILDSRMAHEI